MIKFGTDGWRARIAEDFTMDSVARAAAATARYIKKNKKEKKGFVIGYDHRFLSESFACICANILSQKSIKVYLLDKPVPTQIVSFAVKKLNAYGGIMITASHNPFSYNGFKLKIDKGCSAPPEVTRIIEKELNNVGDVNYNIKNVACIKHVNVDREYFGHISRLLDLNIIRSSRTRAIIDPMYGSGANYLGKFARKFKLRIDEINNWRDPLFGGINPEPLEYNLGKLIKTIKREKKWDLGVALDGDADRLGAVGGNGRFINSQEVYVLLLYHLIKNKKLKGDIVKAFNMTAMIMNMAKEYKLKVHETKIGFKYIADEVLDKDIVLGGEESGGYSIKGHLPERDGIINGLMLMELVAYEGRPLEDILKNLYKKYGYYYYKRFDLNVRDNNKKKRMINKLFSSPPLKILNKKIVRKATLDGLKLFFDDGGWILYRVSGTEPLIRIYVEARSSKDVDKILEAGKKLILRIQ